MLTFWYTELYAATSLLDASCSASWKRLMIVLQEPSGDKSSLDCCLGHNFYKQWTASDPADSPQIRDSSRPKANPHRNLSNRFLTLLCYFAPVQY